MELFVREARGRREILRAKGKERSDWIGMILGDAILKT